MVSRDKLPGVLLELLGVEEDGWFWQLQRFILIHGFFGFDDGRSHPLAFDLLLVLVVDHHHLGPGDGIINLLQVLPLLHGQRTRLPLVLLVVSTLLPTEANQSRPQLG